MVVPGYDPEDLDDHLEDRLSDEDLSRWLSATERAEYERGASLVDLLSREEIERILDLDGDEP